MKFRSEGLPIPEVLDVGHALEHEYPISQRLFGSFLEDAPE